LREFFYMLNLILFGPPGSGKGTQALILTNEYDLKHISTGDLLRAELNAQTPLGIEAKKFMDAGELVPDSVVIGMIANVLVEYSSQVNGFIFDGFPRTVAQAEALDALMDQHQLSIERVLSLHVSEEELTQRILERGKTSGRSDDRDEETVRRRVQEYENKTAPVASYYESQGKLVNIAGEGAIAEITELLCAAISS
jgi:adenylate kinase